MPKYAYVCKECEGMFEVTHSYKETVVDCNLCGKKNCVSKFLGTPVTLKHKQTKKRKQTGEVVQQTIEDVKIEIEDQKRNLRKIKK